MTAKFNDDSFQTITKVKTGYNTLHISIVLIWSNSLTQEKTEQLRHIKVFLFFVFKD